MKSLARVVVFTLTLTLAGAVAPAPGTGDLGSLTGKGIFDAATCVGCVGSGAAFLAMGWGPAWWGVMGLRDGALLDACVTACARAF